MPKLNNYLGAPLPTEPSLSGKRVLVVGLGRFGGGVGVTRWLAEQGALVTVTDQADAVALSTSIEAIGDLPVTLNLSGHDPSHLNGMDLVVVNPAVDKRRSEFFRCIVESGIAWTTELNLFCARCPAPVIGVTGSFGKSTTAAMIAEALRLAVTRGPSNFSGVHFGGNIGRSLLGDLASIRSSDVVVLEVSNAQLEDTPRIGWAPAVAVITNIQPHHLDRYASFADYVNAKLNILAPPARAADSSKTGAAHQRVMVGALHPEAEAALKARIDESVHRVTRLASVGDPSMRLSVQGSHNQINAAMAATTLESLGVNRTVIREALEGFRGLPHRLEFIARCDGVDYFNDSKSTSPSATVVAVEALADRSLITIVGGKRKEGVTYDGCAGVLARRCRVVVCVGESAPDFAEALARADGGGDCIVERAVSLEQSLNRARAHAQPGDAVLFSPGAASFDAYANYTERGAHFVRLVTAADGARVG